MYKESDKLEWIIHGKILAVGSTFAVYETDSQIWVADWKAKNSIE